MTFYDFDVAGTINEELATQNGYGIIGADSGNLVAIHYSSQDAIIIDDVLRGYVEHPASNPVQLRAAHYLGSPEGKINLFRVFNAADIDGMTLLCNWKMTAPHERTAVIQIWDGSYSRLEISDWPANGTLPVKGNGLLHTFDTLTGTAEETGTGRMFNTFSVKGIVDVSGAALAQVTVFIRG